MLDTLGGEIVAWESAPQDRERLDAIFRFVHTVKGSCGFSTFPPQALSHAAEDLWPRSARAEDRRPPLVSAVLAIIDRIVSSCRPSKPEALASEGRRGSYRGAFAERGRALGPAQAPCPARTACERSASRRPLDRMIAESPTLVLARNELARRLRVKHGRSRGRRHLERVSATIAEMRDAITDPHAEDRQSLAPLPRMVSRPLHRTGKQGRARHGRRRRQLDREMIDDPGSAHPYRPQRDRSRHRALRTAALPARPHRNARRLRPAGGQPDLIEICDDGRGIDGDAWSARRWHWGCFR